MIRFLVGILVSVTIAFLGFALIGLLSSTLIMTSDSPFIWTDEFGFWLNVFTSLAMAVVALSSAFIHARLTPRSFLGPVLVSVFAVIPPVALVTLLTLDFMLDPESPISSYLLIPATAIGALLGGLWGASIRLGAARHGEDNLGHRI
jgi:hypothetical protein